MQRGLAQVIRRFEARVAWWNRTFPKDEPAKVLQIAKSQAGALGQTQESSRQRRADAPRDASVPLPMALSARALHVSPQRRLNVKRKTVADQPRRTSRLH